MLAYILTNLFRWGTKETQVMLELSRILRDKGGSSKKSTKHSSEKGEGELLPFLTTVLWGFQSSLFSQKPTHWVELEAGTDGPRAIPWSPGAWGSDRDWAGTPCPDLPDFWPSGVKVGSFL